MGSGLHLLSLYSKLLHLCTGPIRGGGYGRGTSSALGLGRTATSTVGDSRFRVSIGGDVHDLAIHMLRSAEDARKTTGGRETIIAGNVEVLRVTYEVESLMFASNKRMIKCLGLERSGEDRFPVFDVVRCRASGELEFRNPTFEDLRFCYGVLMAAGLVHPQLQEDGTRARRTTAFQPLIETVDVQWPAEFSKGSDLVAVAVSHPPNQGYHENITKHSQG